MTQSCNPIVTVTIGTLALFWVLASVRGDAPATAPAPPVAWGKMEADLRVRASVVGEATKGGKMVIKLEVENVGAAPMNLQEAFAWVFIAMGKGAGVYSEKLDLTGVAADLPGQTSKTVDLSATGKKTFEYRKDLTVVEGYPKKEEADESLGVMENVLKVGKIKARVMVWIPAKKALVVSNTLDVTVGEGEFAAMNPEAKAKVIAELVDGFGKDAFAGQAAHDRAVKVGKECVPALLAALKADAATGPAGPGEQWLVTALCDIGDARAVEPLIAESKKDGVRNVVAYHGVKMKAARLDAAIVEAAGKDPATAAWAARGFAAFGGQVNRDLVEKAMASKDPLVRAGIAEALAHGQMTDWEVANWVALLGDPDEGVRHQTAITLGKTSLKNHTVIGALVAALDKPGEGARSAVCAALEALTGRAAPYDKGQEQKVIAGWKAWWATQKK